MAGRGALTAIVPSGARRCRMYRQRRMARSDAPAATDRFAPKRFATRPGARQRPRPDAENFGGEVSRWPLPPASSFDHLVGEREQPVRNLEAERPCGLKVDNKIVLGGKLYRQLTRFLALENAIDIEGRPPIEIDDVGVVRYQTAARR